MELERQGETHDDKARERDCKQYDGKWDVRSSALWQRRAFFQSHCFFALGGIARTRKRQTVRKRETPPIPSIYLPLRLSCSGEYSKVSVGGLTRYTYLDLQSQFPAEGGLANRRGPTSHRCPETEASSDRSEEHVGRTLGQSSDSAVG